MFVRHATLEDVEAFVAVVAAVAEEGRWIAMEPPVEIDAFALRVRRMLSDGDALFVLDVGGRIVGTLVLHATHAGGVVSLGMSILADHRGRGGGRALLEAAIEHARGAGNHKVELVAGQRPRDRAVHGLRLRGGGRAPRPLPPP